MLLVTTIRQVLSVAEWGVFPMHSRSQNPRFGVLAAGNGAQLKGVLGLVLVLALEFPVGFEDEDESLRA
jgi:hypothetical protein